MPEQALRDAEKSAEKPKRDSSDDGAVDEARAAEGEKYYALRDRGNGTFEEEEHFRSNVTGDRSDKAKKGKLKGRIGLKKKGPLLAIVALLVLFIGLIFVAQSAMPFAIVNRLIEEYNTAGISAVLRADNILDLQLSFSSEELFGLTSYQKETLEDNGVLPFTYALGTMLAYQKEDGKWAVVASTGSLKADPSGVASQLQSDHPDYSFEKFANPMILSVEDAMKDGSFKTPYTTASKTWRGGNAGWADTLSTLNESVRGYTRSRYWYTTTHNVSSSLANSTKLLGYRKGLATTIWNNVTGRRTPTQWLRDTMAGTKVGKVLGIKSSDNIMAKSSSLQKIGLKASSIASAAASLTNIACTGLQLIAKAQTLVGSIQNMQFINLASGYLESVQMVQAGDGDGRAMNEYNENLIASVDGKNAMSSDGMSALMTGSEIDENSESIQRVNPQSALINLANNSSGSGVSNILMQMVGGISDIMSIITTCNAVASGLSALSTVITVAVGAVTMGIGSVVMMLISTAIMGVVSNTLIAPLSEAIVNWVWDNFASTIAKNVATEWLGPDLGNALFSGGNLLLGSGHQIGSGTPAGKEEVMMYKKEQNRIIAEEAEYQRSIRSPFDINSKYTFLGSIVYNLIPLATTTGVGSALKSVSSLVTNSVTAILPTASAMAETNIVQGFGTCPDMEEIGMATPKEAIEKTYENKGITSMTPNADGTFTIVENSNADKFLHFCGERVSNFGPADANIMEEIDNEQKSKDWWRKIPFLGDVLSAIADIASAIFGNKESSGWATGGYCGNTPNNACFWESEGKYYQAFFQDQRILENNGRLEKSSATVALERYHETHPLDQSPEGILARYSGMTKDDVIATLEYINALEYIANYQPEERYAFGQDEAEENVIFIEYTEAPLIATEPKYIVYNTLRERANAIL